MFAELCYSIYKGCNRTHDTLIGTFFFVLNCWIVYFFVIFLMISFESAIDSPNGVLYYAMDVSGVVLHLLQARLQSCVNMTHEDSSRLRNTSIIMSGLRVLITRKLANFVVNTREIRWFRTNSRITAPTRDIRGGILHSECSSEDCVPKSKQHRLGSCRVRDSALQAHKRTPWIHWFLASFSVTMSRIEHNI